MPDIEWRRLAYGILLEFVEMGLRRDHLRLAPLGAYCRNSRARLIGPTLEIAAIDVWQEYQRQGYFKAFLEEAEKIAASHRMALYVENALNPIVHEFLERRGYTESKHAPLCFYKTWG